ncbi:MULTISPECIES: glycosyltransferase family 29 protein [Chitinophagaceae]
MDILQRVLRKAGKIKFDIDKAIYLNQCKKKALYGFDSDWFKNKRVAIVGGANSAFKKPLGRFIDDFDVVVRVNKGVEMIEKHSEMIGTRTDFLFHSLFEQPGGLASSPITLDLWKKHDVKHLFFCHNVESEKYGVNMEKFLIKYRGQYRVTQMTPKMHEANMQTIAPYFPTTGFIAINTIMQCMPASLYITGITFFKTAHQSDYREGSVETWNAINNGIESNHSPDAEYQYFIGLYKKYGKTIELDDTLKLILANTLNES